MAKKTPEEAEAALRKSADKFAADLAVAREAGLSVTWPSTVEGLVAIQVSSTTVSIEQPTDLQPVAGGVLVDTAALGPAGAQRTEAAKA